MHYHSPGLLGEAIPFPVIRSLLIAFFRETQMLMNVKKMSATQTPSVPTLRAPMSVAAAEDLRATAAHVQVEIVNEYAGCV